MTPTPELNKALAAFQAELPRVGKNATADMGTFKNEYAELDVVAAAVLPLLGRHGLAYITCPTIRDDGQRVLEYALVHESGQERGGQYPLPAQATAQQMGGAITYARRYCLLSVTGVHPGGEDDDGAAAEKAPPTQAMPNRTRQIRAEFDRLQVTDAGVRAGYVADLTGRAVNNLRDLTPEQQQALLDVLEKCPNGAALEQRRKQEAQS